MVKNVFLILLMTCFRTELLRNIKKIWRFNWKCYWRI